MDQGLLPLGAELILSGKLIYKDLHTVVWPGSYLILACIYKLFGTSWLVSRSFLIFELTILQTTILILSRKLIKSWFAFLPVIFFVALGPPQWNCNYYHWDALLFYLLSVLTFSQNFTEIKPKQKQYFFSYLSGLFLAIAISCFQSLAPGSIFYFLTAFYIIFITNRCKVHLIRLALSFCFGLFSIFLPLFLYLTFTNNLQHMLNDTFFFVFTRYENVNTVPYGYCKFLDGIWESTGSNKFDYNIAFLSRALALICWSPFEFIKICPIILLFLTGMKFFSKLKIRDLIEKNPITTLYICAGIGFFMAEIHRPDINRLFWGSILFLIVITKQLEAYLDISSAIKNNTQNVIHSIAKISSQVSFFIISTGLCLNILLAISSSIPIMTIASRKGRIACTEDLSIIEKIQNLTKPDETILVYPYDTLIYYLSGTKFPSRFPLLQYRFNSLADFQNTIAFMDRNSVRYVIWDKIFNNKTFAENGYPSLKDLPKSSMIMEEYLERNYKQIAEYGHYRLLERINL